MWAFNVDVFDNDVVARAELDDGRSKTAHRLRFFQKRLSSTS